MINVLPFFFPNAGSKNGPTQLKNLFLNNIERKEEKNHCKRPSLVSQINDLRCSTL